jgi:predicted secreted hydrolase
MLYLLRREDGGADFGRGTVIDPEGGVRWLEPTDWSVRATGRWSSPETGADYPSGWKVEVPSETLAVEVRPVVADQENVGELAGGLHYWEGAVTVVDRSGRRIGRGYVELTGYGEGNRPPV